MKNSYNFLNSNGITFDTGDKYRGFDMNAVRIVESLDLGYPVLLQDKLKQERGIHPLILEVIVGY